MSNVCSTSEFPQRRIPRHATVVCEYQKKEAAIDRGMLLGDFSASPLRFWAGVGGCLPGSVAGGNARSAEPGNLLPPGGVRTSGDTDGPALLVTHHQLRTMQHPFLKRNRLKLLQHLHV